MSARQRTLLAFGVVAGFYAILGDVLWTDWKLALGLSLLMFTPIAFSCLYMYLSLGGSDEVRAAARGEGDRLGGRAHGWFADRDPEDRNDMAWQPVLQLDGMCVSAEVWFSTEGECNAFIADNIIGQSWHPAAARGEGDRPSEWDEHDGASSAAIHTGEDSRPAERHAFYPTTVNGGGKVACGVWLPAEGRMCKRSESDPIHSGEGDRPAEVDRTMQYIAERDAELLRRLGEGPS